MTTTTTGLTAALDTARDHQADCGHDMRVTGTPDMWTALLGALALMVGLGGLHTHLPAVPPLGFLTCWALTIAAAVLVGPRDYRVEHKDRR